MEPTRACGARGSSTSRRAMRLLRSTTEMTMSRGTFELDTTTGLPRPVRRPVAARSIRWTEEHLQHIMVLNPALLGVANHVPLDLTGGTHCRIPDQTYVDTFGRLTVVEVKNEPAGLRALAQLLSYADHWRVAPLGEMLPGFKGLAEDGQHRVLQRALRSIRALAGVATGEDRPRRPDTLKRWAAWPALTGDSVASFADANWGPRASAVSGAQVRAILIAPKFDTPVIELADALNDRSGQLELIEVDLWRPAPRRVGLTWRAVVVPDPAIAATWDLAGHIWRTPAVREAFAVNAWADSLNAKYFSFSCREAPAARFWIRSDGKTAELFTVVPDKWHRDGARERLRRRFLAALPDGHSGGRWIEWKFSLPRQATGIVTCAARVARAISDVLVPAQPH
jgi:hypothetical protein